MTLTAEQSSNKAEYEAAPTAEIIDIIRTAMGEGCVRPCHVYDAVDELICRIQALENRPKRNCDVGTLAEQRQRFVAYCEKMSHTDKACCGGCPIVRLRLDGTIGCSCELAWAQEPHEEGGSK